jgi:tetratricopeptide (TPR) repeat protein
MPLKMLRRFTELLLVTVFTCCGCQSMSHKQQLKSIDARRFSGMGFQKIHDGSWQDAEELFTKALDKSKNDDRAHWGLAESYWNRGETELAVEHMEQAVRLSAGDPKMVQRLGRMYVEIGRLEDAKFHSLWALESERDSAQAWALYGDCLLAAAGTSDATHPALQPSLSAYHRALALQPDYPKVQQTAAEIYSTQQRYDRVLATLDRLHDGIGVAAAPARVDLLRCIALKQEGRTEDAKESFRRAIAKDGNNPDPLIELASLELQDRKVDQSRATLQRAANLAPERFEDGILRQQFQEEEQRLAREKTIEDSQQRR